MAVNINQGGLIWEAGIDDTQLNATIDRIEQRIRDMANNVSKENSIMGDFASQSSNQMKEAIAIQKQAIKELEIELTKLQEVQGRSTGKDLSTANLAVGNKTKEIAAEKAMLVNMQKAQSEASREAVVANNLEKESQSGLIGSIGKWAMGLATVATVMKVGKAIIASTEGATHEFERTIASATAGIGYFFKSIASGDWTNFWQGLSAASRGAAEFVDTMEGIENRKNEEKVKSSQLDIEIGKARAVTFDKESSNDATRKAAYETILRLSKEQFTARQKIAEDEYQANLKAASSASGISKEKLQGFINEYSSVEKLIEQGKRYNKIKALTKEMNVPGQAPIAADPRYQKEIDMMGKAGEEAGKYAAQISKVPMAVRAGLAGFEENSNKLAAGFDMSNFRIKTGLAALNNEIAQKATDAAKKAQEENDRRTKEQINYDTKIGRQRITNQIEIDQNLLELQIDGAEKSKQQAELDFRKTLVQIANQKADMLKEYNELNGGIDQKTGKHTVNYVATLPIEDQSQIDEQIKVAERKKAAAILKINDDEAEKLKKIWDEVADYRLTGIDKEKEAVKDKYDKMAKEVIQLNGSNSNLLLAAIEVKRIEANKAIDNKYTLNKLDFDEQIENRKASLSIDNEEALQKQLFAIWVKYQQLKIDILKKSTDPKDLEQAAIMEADLKIGIKNEGLSKEDKLRKSILDSATKLIEGVRVFNSGLADSLALALNLEQTLAKAFNKKTKITKEDAIGMVISGTTQLISLIANSAKERKQASDEYYASTIRAQQEYNLLLNDELRLNADIKGSLFLKDYEGRLVSGTKAYNDAQSKYRDELKKFADAQAIVGSKNVVSGTTVLGAAGAGAAAGAGIGALLGGGILSIPAAIAGSIIGGIAGALTGLFAKKPKDVTAPLIDTYPELIKANGEFDAALAKTLITNNKVTEATKQTLQNLIDWKDAADKATEQLKQVVSDLAGSLGDDLRTALVAAFTDGTDAAQAFGTSVNKVLENILSNMIFNKVFEGAFKTLENNMIAKPDGTGWLDALSKFFAGSGELIKQFNDGLSDAQTAAAQAGFANLFKPVTASSTASTTGQMTGYMKGVSEETASVIGGQLNAMRLNQAMTLSIIRDQLLSLHGIKQNTDPIPQYLPYLKHLQNIDSNMGSTSSLLSGTGIKVRF